MTDERLRDIKRSAAALALMKPGNVWTADVFELAAEVERLQGQIEFDREDTARGRQQSYRDEMRDAKEVLRRIVEGKK